MLIHGYTVFSSYVNSAYEAGYSNIYQLNRDVNNGYKIPTLLRLFGTLSPAEIGTSASNLKLAVIPDRSVAKFFAVNQFYYDPSTTTPQGCGGTTAICYSFDDGQSSKITSPSDNWSLNPFILLDLGSVTSELSEAVALLLKPKKVPRTINLGTALPFLESHTHLSPFISSSDQPSSPLPHLEASKSTMSSECTVPLYRWQPLRQTSDIFRVLWH